MKAGQIKARNKNLLREEREARPRFKRISVTIYLKKFPIATLASLFDFSLPIDGNIDRI